MLRLREQNTSETGALFLLFCVWLAVFSKPGCGSQEYEKYKKMVQAGDDPSAVSEHEFPKEHVATRSNYTGPGQWARPPPDLAAKIGFVPMKLYAQVRHTNSVKHLPRSEAIRTAATAEEIATAPHLREVVSTKKLGEVYTEEGYEDSAYDHADFEKKKEDEEGYEYAEIEVARARSGRRRQRGDDSEYQGSDVDSEYAGATVEEVTETGKTPSRPKMKLKAARREKHTITVEDKTKRVYPSSVHTSYSYTVRQPRPSFYSQGLPVNTLRTQSRGRGEQHFAEPNAAGTSPLLIQRGVSSSETGGGESSRNHMEAEFNVTVPATVLTPPKPSSDDLYEVSYKNNIFPQFPSKLHDLGEISPYANDVAILYPELTKGTANNFEKILLPQFFTTNVYGLYLGIKKNNDLTGIVLNPEKLNSNESKGPTIVSSLKPSETGENDTGIHSHEKYVSGLTMLHFGVNSTTTTETTAVRESGNSDLLTNVEPVEILTAMNEPTSVSERLRVRRVKSPTSSPRTATHARDKGRRVRNRSAGSRDRGLKPRRRQGTKNSDTVTASSRRVRPRTSPPPSHRDLDVGMSEKKFLFAFENIFQEPMESVEPVSKDSSSSLKNAINPTIVTTKNVTNTRSARGTGFIKPDNLRFPRENKGGNGKTHDESTGDRKHEDIVSDDQGRSKSPHANPRIAAHIEYDSEKYPFYSKLPSNAISVNSPIRYAIDPRTIPKKTETGMEFYESRENVYCPEVSPNLDVIPKRKSPGEWNESPRPKLPRLSGLGDKIDCLRTKYFGSNPLDNPFFSESTNIEPKQGSENMESISKFIEKIKSLENGRATVKQV